MLRNLFWIIGKAGTGKTTSILKQFEGENNLKFLSFTHCGVENLKQRLNKNEDKFETIHKFFKIGLTKDKKNKIIFGLVKKFPRFVIIDEFGLIPLDIMNLIFYYAKEEQETNFYLIGDLLQLSAIGNEINFKLEYLNEMRFDSKLIQISDLGRILEHLSKSVWFLPEFRKGNKVIFNEQYRNKNLNLKDMKTKLFNAEEYKSEDWFFIASKKKILRKIGKLINLISDNKTKDKEIKTILGYVSENELCISYSSEFNFGRIDKGINFNENEEITPLRLLTLHKSQGMEFNNVVVIVDDLVEHDLSGLYTAATRAKNKIILTYLDKDLNIKNNIRELEELEDYINKRLNK